MKTKNTNSPLPKTLILSASNKGGATKTTSMANIADGLTNLGYRPLIADGDQTNCSMGKLIPAAIKLDIDVTALY